MSGAANYPYLNIAASTTAQEIVPAVPGKSIRVLALAIMTGTSATTITLNSASTAISMNYQCAENGGIVLPLNGNGWMQTNVGENLTVTSGAGATTGVQVLWVAV